MTASFRTLAFPMLLAFALPAAAQAGDAAAGQAVFKTQCGVCHAVVQGKNMIGPSLFGLIGRTSGGIEGFRYSAANKAASIVWSAETLNKYLAAPKAIVPGTTMTYAGLKDETKRADLIAYLTTVK